MAKKAYSASKNKKHLARLEVERRQQKMIVYTAIAVIAVVIILVGYMILDSTVLLPSKTVVSVGGDKVTVHELQVRTRMRRQQLIQTYITYYQFSQAYGFDLTSQMDQLTNDLSDPTYLGQMAMDDLIGSKIVAQEAARRGITVSAAEIDSAIQEGFGYFPSGSPTPTLTPTPPIYATLSAAQIAMVTLTPTPGDPPTTPPTATSSAPTATSFPEPTATPYTQEGFQKAYDDNMTYMKDLQVNEADYRKGVEQELLYKKIFDLITADVKPEQEQVWARHILVDSEEKAKEVYAKLMNGEDFSSLAAEYSMDGSATTGGDLGWNAHDAWVPEFADAAFALKVGEVSQPVQSQFGWHIIQAIGHENRPLTADQFEQAKQTAFDNWLTEQKAALEIKYTDGWEQYIPTDPDLNATMQKVFGSQ